MNLTVSHRVEEKRICSWNSPVTKDPLCIIWRLYLLSGRYHFSWFADEETIHDSGNLLKVTHLKSGRGGISIQCHLNLRSALERSCLFLGTSYSSCGSMG